MNLYLDTSALIKLYAIEPGASDVRALIQQVDLFATARITRAEMAAALAKSIRMKIASRQQANRNFVAFQSDWPAIFCIEVSEIVVNQATLWAWDYNLRGYDAIHLAAAGVWQKAIDETVTIATFDRQLWTIAQQVSLAVYPLDLPALLATW